MPLHANYIPPGPPNYGPIWDNLLEQQLTVGTPYSLILAQVCHDPEGNVLNFTMVSGSLPPGVLFNDAADVISGTPSSLAGTSATFRAFDGENAADITLTFNCLNADTTAPTVPTGLAATVVSDTQIDLTWDASTDPDVPNARTSGMNGYVLFRNNVFYKNVPSNSYSAVGLTPNTLYEFYLKSKDKVNNQSIQSSRVQASTTIKRRYNPGHYSTHLRGVRDNASRNLMTAQTVPGITKGWIKRYAWRQFEPQKDIYPFETDPNFELTLDLAWAQANNLQLIAMIEDKTFVDDKPNPAYLEPWTFVNSTGWMMARHDPYYVERLKILITKLAAKYDPHPNFEGFSTQETSGSSIVAPPGPGKLYIQYTPEIYRDALIDVAKFAMAKFFRSRLFWFMNYCPGNLQNERIDEAITACIPTGGFNFGGPDIMPNSSQLVNRVYWMYPPHKDECPIFCSAQQNSYEHTKPGGGFYTMQEIFDYGVNNLHINYMFWSYVAIPAQVGARTYEDAKAVMIAHPNLQRGDMVMLKFWERLTDDQLIQALDEYDENWGMKFWKKEDAAKDFEDSTEFAQICEDILHEEDEDDEEDNDEDD